MTITQQPSALNLSGNLPDIVATAVVAPVSFELYKDAELILSENYQPSAEQTIRIRLKDMISQLLEVEVPPFDNEIFHQSKSYASFTAEVGAETISFKVVKGGVDLPNPDASVFLAGNFLTWQPQEKKVKYHDPEWLTYYAASTTTVRVKAYFQGSTTQTTTLTTLPAGQVASINMNYGHIRGKFAQQPLYFDVWAEVSSVRKSFIQRYIFDVSCDDYDDLFVFENTLGGIDNIRFTGQRTRIDSFDTESALFDENTNEYFSEADRSTEKNTGYFPNERLRIWALEFFASYQRYHLDDGVLKRILVAKPELSAERHRLADYVFVFQPSHQTRFMNLPRQDSLPENLNIIGPGDEVFFLAPRLNEFAGASDLANALFPVQLAFEDEWRKVTFNELVQAVSDASGGQPIMTLAGLNDTAISNPQEDDGLFYNPATQKWHNKPFSFNPSDYLTLAAADGRYVTQATDQLSLPGNKGWTGRHHFTGSLSIPQAAPVEPVAGQAYIWFGNPGGGSTPPPAYGNLEDLQNVANVIDDGKYLRKVGGEWTGVDITFPDLSGYATQSWVNSQGFLKSPDLAAYATQAWANGRFVTQATEQLSLSGNKGWTGRHHFTGALSIPQEAPVAPVAGQAYVWFGSPGSGSTPPPDYGNLEDLQNVANVIDDGKYLRKVGGQWVGVDISFPDLSSYATQSWVNSQGFLKSPDLAAYATQAWANGRFVTQATEQLSLSGNKGWTGRHHFTGALSIPQEAPVAPVAGQAYVWFGSPGSGSTPPPDYGNLEDLQNVANVIDDGKYLRKVGGQWVGVDISFPDLSGYATQSWVTAGFAPISHTHTIAQVTGLQSALDGKEAAFVKNTAFNKNFGTAAGTVAQGNDSRIINGQTAHGWGNHQLAGYAVRAADNTFTAHNHFSGALSIPQSAPSGAHADQAYIWFGSSGSGGGGGGESGTLAGLDDVALSSLANNQLIRYNSSTGMWVNFTANYAPASHTHTISQVTGLQGALDGKEPTFSKNTGFNKNFGTTSGTVAQGNDARIVTAYDERIQGMTTGFGGYISLTRSTTNLTARLRGIYASDSRTDWTNSNGNQTYIPPPNDSDYNRSLSLNFTTDWGGSGWGTVLTAKGWSNEYAAWQLSGPAHHASIQNELYFRTGIGASWNTRYRIWHSGNFGTGTTSQYIRGDGSLATFPSIPSNYVTTNSTQTGLVGIKRWSSGHSWTISNESQNPTVSANTIGMGFSTGNGVWLQANGTNNEQSFLLRAYALNGVQANFASGGIAVPSGGSDKPAIVSNGATILRHTASNNTLVSANSGSVYLRPTGDNSSTNEAIFASDITLRALTGSGTQMVMANASGVLSRQSIPTIGNGTLTMTGGNGLTGSATFSANQTGNSSFTVALGTPGSLSHSTTNSVSGSSHTHELSDNVFSSRGNSLSGDLNNITWTGYATVPTAANATLANNYPIAGNGGSLINLHGGTYVTQLFNNRSASRFFWRGRTTASNWGDWSEIWHSGNITPVPTSRQVATGNHLTGGGNLSANRTLSVAFTTSTWMVDSQGNDRMYFGSSSTNTQWIVRASRATGTFQFRNLANSTLVSIDVSSGKITCPVIEPTAFIVPASAPSSPESNKRYLWVS